MGFWRTKRGRCGDSWADALDDCIKEALSAGALGAKLSGGGWGGIMFALCREKDVSAVKKAIASTGAETIETEIGACGITVSE